MADKPWFLYLIECKNGRLYVGITPDLHARFAAHAAGKGAMFTKLNRPQRMLAAKPYGNRSEASKAEIVLKGLTPVQKRLIAGQWPVIESLPSADQVLAGS